MSERQELLVAGHEELSVARFSQRQQITVLWVRRDNAGREAPTKKREVPKTCREQFGRADSKSGPEKRSNGDLAQFRYKPITGDQRESLPLPGIQQLCGRTQRRQQRGEQDVGVEDEAHQGRWARSR